MSIPTPFKIDFPLTALPFNSRVESQLNLDKNLEFKQLRENKNNVSKYLSQTSINNIINFYENDYKILNILYNHKFIDSFTLESYRNYQNP